jgi:hypothetical protein
MMHARSGPARRIIVLDPVEIAFQACLPGASPYHQESNDDRTI